MGFDTVRSIVAARAWSGRSGGIPLRAATSIVATVHWTDRSFRLRKPPTEFPPLEALGGFPRGLLVPNQRFGRFFPFISASFRNLPSTPVFAGLFHLFPGISAYFQTVLNWTFGVFLQLYRFNHPLQPTGLQHDRTALFYIPSATHFASSTFRSSLAFNSSST